MRKLKEARGFDVAIAKLIDKLAGKVSNLELTFNNLTLEFVGLKAKLNGSIRMDILYASEKK